MIPQTMKSHCHPSNPHAPSKFVYSAPVPPASVPHRVKRVKVRTLERTGEDGCDLGRGGEEGCAAADFAGTVPRAEDVMLRVRARRWIRRRSEIESERRDESVPRR